ncbi:cbb3-type cytochrome c oxidase subunit 3 [Labrys okinawensis]|uniref:cbb3-type cytochrome c oxidase subunit 3 n=1 Tax=Labrys okinawensis TaxID=346911 RepID=UPI0039BD1AA9
MSFDYDTVVWFSKSFGLFYLLGFSVAVLAYTFWPSNREPFDRARTSILSDEDKPCR